MVGFGGLMIVLALLFYRIPGLHMLLWSAIGAASAGAVVLGVVRNRPRRPLPWVLIAAGLLAFTLGDTTYNFLTSVLDQEQPFPSAADAIYLGLFFPLLAAGVVGLARSGAANRDRASLLDALALTVGVGLLFWLFLIDPHVTSDEPVLDRVISVAYPLCDILLLAVTARLVTAVRWSPAVLLLALGGSGLLVADVLYGISQLGGTWLIGGPVDLGWIVFYACFGLAALHPSMTALTAPRLLPTTGLEPGRLIVVALSTLIAPIVVVVEAANGSVRNAGVAAVVAGLMFLLVMARLFAAMNAYRAAVARERGLRQAAVALVAATTVHEVDAVTRTTVAGLFPAGTPHRAVLHTGSTLAHDDPGHGPARIQLVATRTLDPDIGVRLRAFDTVAYSRLVIGEAPSIRDHGTLFVAAGDQALAVLRESLHVLSTQTASALDRIALNEEIGRRNTEVYFRTLVQNASDVILIVDDAGTVTYASPSAASVFGRPEVTGLPLATLVEPANAQSRRSHTGAIVDASSRNGSSITDWLVIRGDGARVQVEASTRDLREDPTVAGIVVTLRDVTERRQLEEELTHRAYHDDLTGLPNRSLFQTRVNEAVAASQRNGTITGVLFLDLDDFKVVNDTMGHATGDDLLRAVSTRLRGALRDADTAARLGGDEFAALIADFHDVTEIEDAAERVIAALSEPFTAGPAVVNGTASIGVATTADANDGEELMRQSDMALYVAKGAGKGQWRRYQTALHTAVLERMRTRNELDHALQVREFTVEFQPVVALDSTDTVGFEALIRWQHPHRGLVSPDEFIAVAEESGQIVPIGEWVLDTALAEAATWAELARDKPPHVSVNVSARQLRQPGFVDGVLAKLERYQLPPQQLVLEITESLLLRDNEQVWADLAALRRAGARVAIDDFGTGYSSLSYLRQVPADVLKIERSFIDNTPVSDQQRGMVESVVRLAKTLHLSVVAEGIEEPAERAVLLDIGCHYGQGYLFSRALTATEATNWLQRERVRS